MRLTLNVVGGRTELTTTHRSDKARIEGEPLMEFWMKDSTRELGESFVKYGVDVALRKNAANPTADNALEEARKRIEELKSGVRHTIY